MKKRRGCLGLILPCGRTRGFVILWAFGSVLGLAAMRADAERMGTWAWADENAKRDAWRVPEHTGTPRPASGRGTGGEGCPRKRLDRMIDGVFERSAPSSPTLLPHKAGGEGSQDFGLVANNKNEVLCLFGCFFISPAWAWRETNPEQGQMGWSGDQPRATIGDQPRARLGDQAAPGGVIVGVDGTRRVAKLAEIDANGRIVFSDRLQRRVVDRRELVTWGSYVDRGCCTVFLMVDGGVLAADLVSMEASSITVAGGIWAETQIPRSQVRAVLFRASADSTERDSRVDRAIEHSRESAQLLLENGDKLVGDFVPPVRAKPGEFYPTSLHWQLADASEPVVVSLSRVLALSMNSPLIRDRVRKEQRLAVGWSDGSLLAVRRIWREKNAVQVELMCGARLATEPVLDSSANPWGAVTFLQPFGGGVTYLSDLEPASYKCLPYFDVEWPYRRDRSVVGSRLRHDGQVSLKGLGMHSNSRLSYDLDAEYDRFQAELALDERAGRKGSVVYRVYAAGLEGKWSKVLESAIIRGGQPPVSIDVDISGVKRLALIVNSADRADEWDHANWLNARLIKRRTYSNGRRLP